MAPDKLRDAPLAGVFPPVGAIAAALAFRVAVLLAVTGFLVPIANVLQEFVLDPEPTTPGSDTTGECPVGPGTGSVRPTGVGRP